MWNGVVFGVAFAAVVLAIAWPLAPTRQRAFLALLLAAAAAVYVGAALSTPAASAPVQTIGFVAFAGGALLGWERGRVLAAGWLAHAAWDLAHVAGAFASGLPPWYEIGCLVADPILAAYLLLYSPEPVVSAPADVR